MIADLLSRLRRVRQTGRNSWVASCPSHEDKSPSLTIRDADGLILLHCFAGCEPLAVVEAVGLKFADLFPEPQRHTKPMRRQFPAADVLECLSLESKVILVLGHRVVKGLPITETDMSRLRIALSRIEDGRELANG